MPKDKKAAKRTAKNEASKKARGYARPSIWIPDKNEAWLKDVARKICERYEETLKND